MQYKNLKNKSGMPPDTSLADLYNSFRDGINTLQAQIGPDVQKMKTFTQDENGTPQLKFIFPKSAMPDTTNLPTILTNAQGETAQVSYVEEVKKIPALDPRTPQFPMKRYAF